jgi:D-3-phosphoglycerate dehydrogenase / 2-oxoglutarate reductase
MSVVINYIDAARQRDELLREFGGLVEGVTVFAGDPSPAELIRRVRDADIVLNGHTGMGADILAAAARLRSIVFLGTGAWSYVDVTEAERRGIAVRTIGNYGDRTIAEHAFGLLLAAARGFARMDRDMRSGIWTRQEGVELHGKTLGVVGCGAIGSEMVRMAAGFGMRVIAWNRSGVPADLPCEAVALDELLATSDAISIHMAQTPETEGFFDRTHIRRMRKGVLLVNVARGALFDEAELVAALRDGHIAHAGLDVFTTEPLPLGHAFATLANVTLSAHTAWNSREASLRLLREGLELARADAESLAAGRPLTR